MKDEKEATENYNLLRDYYKKVTIEEELLRVVVALTTSKHISLLNRTFEMCLNGEVRTQDIIKVLNGTNCPRNTIHMWNFFKANYDVIVDKVKHGTMMLPSLVDRMTSCMKDVKMIKDFEEFSKNRDISMYQRALINSKEAIAARHERIERDVASLKNYKF